MRQLPYDAHQISAIGHHGQTVFHNPDSLHPFTLQLGNPNFIAQKTGIPVISDFRRMDITVGGTGAPLAPISTLILICK
ncbi:MAG: hypothetical protein HAW62_02225 [Endozoicomonadaceae bacterium]|nr:hypothetical protein [Endozoicomonadaceae bacterium]